MIYDFVFTVFQAMTAGYGMMGLWFAFNALVPSDHALIKEDKPVVPSKGGSPHSEVTMADQHDNLVEVLLICAITSILGGSIRFLSSLFLMRSLTKVSIHEMKQNKTLSKQSIGIDTFHTLFLIT